MSDNQPSEIWLSYLGGNGEEAKKLLSEIKNFIAGGESRHAREYMAKCSRAAHCIDAMKTQAVKAVNAAHPFKGGV